MTKLASHGPRLSTLLRVNPPGSAAHPTVEQWTREDLVPLHRMVLGILGPIAANVKATRGHPRARNVGVRFRDECDLLAGYAER